jgi:hypothetical protein
VHNSGWVQSPGAVTLADVREYPRLRAYVQGVVGAFAQDRRILGWDIWNQPPNPIQPLTSGVYGDWRSTWEYLPRIAQIRIKQSDILTLA